METKIKEIHASLANVAVMVLHWLERRWKPRRRKLRFDSVPNLEVWYEGRVGYSIRAYDERMFGNPLDKKSVFQRVVLQFVQGNFVEMQLKLAVILLREQGVCVSFETPQTGFQTIH